MSSITACEGEACWATGWLQHSFTISSNISQDAMQDALQLVNVGLAGPLTKNLTADSFPTRYVPFNLTIVGMFFLLIITILLHEIYASDRKPILASTEKSSTLSVQLAFLFVKFQMMIYVAMVVPISLDYSLEMGESATMSGLWLSSPLFGAIIGVMIGKNLTNETDWDQVFARRLLVWGPISSCLSILGMGYLVNSAAERSLGDKRLTFWLSLFLLQVQTILSSMSLIPMSVMQNKMTPKSEMTFWMIMGQSATSLGLLLGPGLFGVVAYSVKGGHDMSPASLLGWVNLVLGIIWIIGSNFLSWALPTKLVPLPEEAAEQEEEKESCVSVLPPEDRERIVKNQVWYSLERPFSISAIEVGTIMLLEVSYHWATELSGTVFTVVSATSLIFSLISTVMLSYNCVSESAVFLFSNILCLVGAVFLFDFGTGPAGLLVADGLVYGMTSVSNGISDGWATKAAIEETDYNVENFRMQQALGMSVARFLSPILTRTLMDFGGRNLYAAMQFFFVAVSTLTVYKSVKMVWDNTERQGGSPPKKP